MKSTRTVLLAVVCGVLALAVLGVSGCSNQGVAARVNGQAITTADVQAQLDQLKKQYPNMFTGADGEGRLLDFKKRILDNLVNQTLVEQAAKKQGITITDADIQKQIDQLKSGFKDQAQFEQALTSAGMSTDALKTQIRNQLLTQKLIEKLSTSAKVTDADIKAYYDKNKQQFYQAAAKRASHILFKPSDKAQAQKVLKELQGGADFAALAKKYSTDTATASKGGDLGWPTAPYVPEFQAALDKLDKGQMSVLVQTPYGWHIIKVTDTRAAVQQTIDQVKKQIEQIILQQRRADSYQQYLNQLRKDAKIDIIEEDLKPSATTTATPSAPSTSAPQ
jgi:foldase protein PrsA